MSCQSSAEKTASDHISKKNQLSVSVTFNAIAEFAQAVGKDKVKVSTIIPAGTEPHDFEPKARDIAKLADADVFIYNGLGMEAWTDEAVKASANSNLVVIDASKGATPIKTLSEDEKKEHGSYDPHLWLSIKGAELEVQNIADGFSKADPKNKDFYQKNAANYNKKLEALYTAYQVKFSSLKNKTIVTGHAAFHYFCQDFGLEQNSVEDVFAEGEPSSKQLGTLVEYCKKNHITTIFAEDMVSPEISHTLANEVGARIETIHTMESAEDDLSYLYRMKENCEKIYEGLQN
jgi:ABC-type metal ion transport system, periplasmic component/surface adhesin